MSKHNRKDDNKLAIRHRNQIAYRPVSMIARLRSVWGLTWRPGGRSGSFNGKLFRKLGTAIAQVQVSYLQPNGYDGVALFGVAAMVNPHTGVVSYDDLKLCHEFHRVFVGARGAILDPSDDSKGGRGNGSWVQLGLEVDRLRERAVEKCFELDTTPELPGLYFAYGSRAAAKFEVTEALIEKAAADTEITYHGELQGFTSEFGRLRRQAFEALPVEEREAKLKAAWESVFVSPKDPENTTGLWLLPQQFVTNVFGTVSIFECFAGLAGAHIFNPACKLGGKTVDNPAYEVAKAAGVELPAVIQALEIMPPEDLPGREELATMLLSLVPAYRQALGAAPEVGDDDLLRYLITPDDAVVTEAAIGDLPEAEQLKVMRSRLAPHISECCTDGDILNAVAAPASRLYASGLCRVQTLYRNPRMPIEEALRFTPEALGRDRVQATLWHPMPEHKPKQPRKPQAEPQHVAAVVESEPEPVAVAT